MKTVPLRVIKLGGSLLESHDWAARLMHWLSLLPTGRTLLLVGGGPPVDAIRHLACLYEYDLEFLHWLCIDALDISFRLVEQQLHWPSLHGQNELQAWLNVPELTFGLVHTQAFYRVDNYQQQPVALPLNWDTTSDALAALLARLVCADELIVVKSLVVEEPYDWKALAEAGVVDKAFANAIKGLCSVRLSTF